MVEKYSRAQRRHDRARLKIKRQYHWGYGLKKQMRGGKADNTKGMIHYMSKKVAGKVVNTPTPCACMLCANPRRVWQEVTRQESKAQEAFDDQVGFSIEV